MRNRNLSRALWGMAMFLFLTGPPAFAADKKTQHCHHLGGRHWTKTTSAPTQKG